MNNLYNFNLYSVLEEYKLTPNNIDDMNTYLVGMQKSMQDKLFFLDKIDPDVIVDFGCADGAMLKELSKISDIKLIGYDIDEDMLVQARQNVGDSNIILTDNWNKIDELVRNYERPAILLSSVIHEVYSYTHAKTVNHFWNRQVFDKNFKYVIIRDMMPSTRYEKFNMIDIKKIRERSDPKYLDSFEKRWGSINGDFRTLLHWFLKYRYTENWAREVNENYLPLSIETLKKKIPSNYNIIFEDYYTLPFLKDIVKTDFGVDLEEPTHIKMIIENKFF